MGFKVLYTFPTRPQGMDIVREVATVKCLRDKYPPSTPITEDEVLKEIADVDAFVNVRHVPVTRRIIEAAKKLKIIARHGLGYETVELEAATERKVIVTRTAGQGACDVVEYTIGALVALSKKFIQSDASVKSGKWETYKCFGIQMRDKTLGIIGFGGIGAEVARVAKALQMRIIACDPLASEERARDLGVELVDLHRLLRESDYVSLHASVTESSKGILGKKEFWLMKRGAFVVNCARGVMLDEKALYDALISGKLAGAALDVFEKEPPPKDSPLFELENVLLTPHIAGMSEESAEGMSISIGGSVAAVLKGRLPRLENVVNKTVLNSPPWDKMIRSDD